MISIRERIIAACIDLMQEKGIYRLTVDEIANQAGLSKRTLYRYFPSKDELIEATLVSWMETMGQQIAAVLQEDLPPEEVFPQLFNRLIKQGTKIINPNVIRDLKMHYPHLWQKIDEYRLERVKEFIMPILAKSNQERQPSLDPRIISAIIIAVVQNVINPDFILKNNLTFEDTGKQVLDFLQYGLFKKTASQ